MNASSQLEQEMGSTPRDPDDVTVTVRLWSKFKFMKDIFPLNDAFINLTAEELGTVDPEKWVEIPDRFMHWNAGENNTNKTYPMIAIERRRSEKRVRIISDRNEIHKAITQCLEMYSIGYVSTIIMDYMPKMTQWPSVCETDDWRQNLGTGDIVDVRDMYNKWYESMIRYVYPKNSDKFGKCIVHYIGWEIRWDEIIDIYDEERLMKRNTHTIGPYDEQRHEPLYQRLLLQMARRINDSNQS